MVNSTQMIFLSAIFVFVFWEENCELVRTRDEEIIKTGEVLDVGRHLRCFS